MDIQEQLRKAILDAEVSRYALSKMTGVNQGVLSRFVNRERSITMDTAAKLATALGLELKRTRQRKGG
ncbi:MAG: helix-turn-helix transcriptional regulator [Planctomycetes bacterium]|nr:helix-turn-helix transcriptional regulator [Planctomycetota bacterium]